MISDGRAQESPNTPPLSANFVTGLRIKKIKWLGRGRRNFRGHLSKDWANWYKKQLTNIIEFFV